VAGIIAGSGEVRGVAPEAMLLNGKVLDDSGNGTMSSVIAGINWAIEQNADVINLSLGAPMAEENTPLNQAIRDAIAQGIVVVVAAGNCGSDCGSS
jgi:subtilisin family serine protease